MEIIYRAYDGKEFYTSEECLYHEQTNPLFKMYNVEGEIVHSPADCYLLLLIDPDDGARAFIGLCEKYDISYGEFNQYESTGWYWWEDDDYLPISETMLQAIYKAGYFE